MAGIQCMGKNNDIVADQKWFDYADKYESSGMSMKAWCQKESLSFGAFKYWYTRIRSRNREDEPAEGVTVKAQLPEVKREVHVPAQQFSDDQWMELLKEWESSGLSAYSWCQQKGIAESTFRKYRIKLGDCNPAEEELWRQRLKEQEDSGLCLKAWCKGQGLSYGVTSFWKLRISRNREQEAGCREEYSPQKPCSEDQWGALIAEQMESDLTTREWCRQKGISETVYYYQLNKIEDRFLPGRESWSGRIQRFKESGMDYKDWCRQEGCNPKVFRRWYRRLCRNAGKGGMPVEDLESDLYDTYTDKQLAEMTDDVSVTEESVSCKPLDSDDAGDDIQCTGQPGETQQNSRKVRVLVEPIRKNAVQPGDREEVQDAVSNARPGSKLDIINQQADDMKTPAGEEQDSKGYDKTVQDALSRVVIRKNDVAVEFADPVTVEVITKVVNAIAGK